MNFIDSKQGKKYLDEFTRNLKPSSKKVYRSEIKQFFDDFVFDISELTESHVAQYHKKMLHSVSNASMTRKISILSKFFFFLEGKIKGFKSPISKKYGSQLKYQGNYHQSERFQRDCERWTKIIPTKSTKKIYLHHVNHFFKWFQNSPKEINANHLTAYKDYLKKYSNSTIWLKMISLRSFLKEIIGTEKTQKLMNIHQLNLAPPKKDKGYYQVLSENELQKLLDQPDLTTLIGLRDYAILRLMCTYGLRANEICKLTYRNFERNRIDGQQKLWINDRKGRRGKRPDTAIILNGLCLDAIDKWTNTNELRKHDNLPLFNQFKYDVIKGIIKLDMERISQFKPLTVRTIEYIIDKYVKSAAIPVKFTISPHALRHSALTLLAKEGVQLIDLKYLAGHQDISTTMIYIHSVQTYKDHVGMYHPLNKRK